MAFTKLQSSGVACLYQKSLHRLDHFCAALVLFVETAIPQYLPMAPDLWYAPKTA